MRIHGDKEIARRSNVEKRNNYHDYANPLQEDFYHMCGYCGKCESVTTKGFEIDHFVPDNIDKGRRTDYSNLVHSCFTCNRKKSGKWPTEDKQVAHNNLMGFVDPATEEYDRHLERDENGCIIHKTDVGKYMCEVGFKFNCRPIKEIWKYMKLIEVQSVLESRIEYLAGDEMKAYIELNISLKKLRQYFFDMSE